MTPEEIHAEVVSEALGALSWMDGYTDLWPDGLQRRVVTVAETDGSVTKHFEVPGLSNVFGEPARRFRISVQVEEVEVP